MKLTNHLHNELLWGPTIHPREKHHTRKDLALFQESQSVENEKKKKETNCIFDRFEWLVCSIEPNQMKTQTYKEKKKRSTELMWLTCQAHSPGSAIPCRLLSKLFFPQLDTLFDDWSLRLSPKAENITESADSSETVAAFVIFKIQQMSFIPQYAIGVPPALIHSQYFIQEHDSAILTSSPVNKYKDGLNEKIYFFLMLNKKSLDTGHWCLSICFSSHVFFFSSQTSHFKSTWLCAWNNERQEWRWFTCLRMRIHENIFK